MLIIPVQRCCQNGCHVAVDIVNDHITAYTPSYRSSYHQLTELGAAPLACVSLCECLKLESMLWLGPSLIDLPAWRTFCNRAGDVIRSHVDARSPILVVGGDDPPNMYGTTFRYTNKSGSLIRHPGAYRAARGNPIYHPSTRRIEVGVDWLASQLE